MAALRSKRWIVPSSILSLKAQEKARITSPPEAARGRECSE